MGYGQSVAQASAQYGNILQGYQALQSGITAGLRGSEAAAAQGITDQYAAQRGQAQQQMINSGLGNSTVMGSAMRGLGYDEAKARVGLAGQTAQQLAGYTSQIGLAGLGAVQRESEFGQNLSQQQAEMSQRGRLGMAGIAMQGQGQMLNYAQGMAGLGVQRENNLMSNQRSYYQGNQQNWLQAKQAGII